MPTRKIPPIAGEFHLGSDKTFYGYIDIGDLDRINCRLVPQQDPSVITLEEYMLEAPTGTGKPFKVWKEK
jgi:hypothetical protein